MSDPDGAFLVLGIGNVLLRDEGVGIAVIRALETDLELGRIELPPNTRLLDGGTLGLDLLPIISDARALIVVDAVDVRGAPGVIRIIHGDELHVALAGHVSPHQVGVGDLLSAARMLGTLPEAVALIGIQPGEIAIGLELTPAVAAAVPMAVAAVLEEVARLEPAGEPRTIGSVPPVPGPTPAGGPGPAAFRAVPTPASG